MQFAPFILREDDRSKIPVIFTEMTKDDSEVTVKDPLWQSNWTNSTLKKHKRFSLKTEDKELVALAAYEIKKELVHVRIVYMESHPDSNPTLTKDRKYIGIGRVLIAFGIKLSVDCGFEGNVTFEAKTPELAKHYERDFGAVRVSSYGSIAPRYTLLENEARSIFVSYLE